MAQFDYPVPGQSLTTTPRNASYERPPQITEPQEALKAHIDNLSKKESVEDIKYYVEMGLDVKSIVEALLRSAVAEGIHSIDISLIIAPLLHQIIVTLLDKMGIEYDEGSNVETDPDIIDESTMAIVKQKVKARMGEPVKEKPVMKEPEMEEEKPTGGLMARGATDGI